MACDHAIYIQYLSGRGAALHRDVRKSWRARIVLAIAESKVACRRHPIGPIPEVRHFSPNYNYNEAKHEEFEGPEGRVTALLVTGKSNAHCEHATRAARKPGGRATLVFDLGCADLTEKGVQGHLISRRARLSG